MDIIQIAEVLNEKAKGHRIGEIQTIRYKIGRQDKKAIQKLFYISQSSLKYWGNWVLLFGGVKEFLFCLYLDNADHLWYGLSLPLKDKGMFDLNNDTKRLKEYVERINLLLNDSPNIFSGYSMWYEMEKEIKSCDKVAKILPEQLENAEAVFIGNSIKIEKLDYDLILGTFDKMLDIYIKVNTGNFEANYESLRNYEPPPKPRQIQEWSDNLIQETEQVLEDLSFVGNPERGGVCMKKNDGTFGVISFMNVLNRKYIVDDEDGNTESYLSIRDLIRAGWVLD